MSLRGSEATEAIHKKVDSSMDRHAVQSKARDDRKSNNSKPTKQAAGFAMRKPAKRCKRSAAGFFSKALFYERGRRDLPKR
ncbi:hypothetical protein [Helicobacter zhangjianzhongii]|uniref:hypothetical protein n=1 Tax=Helicobacter zhangjianzhongii TaxID=2974574 RepID=UPI0025559270|nr:hypothetical protein [Helicobacter sp. CPD2-1]MDL0079385.1 hypothetical protein [Helicobacter sp. CPD2-1]